MSEVRPGAAPDLVGAESARGEGASDGGSARADGPAERAEQLGALWDDFHATRDPRARDELVTAYFPLVKHLSRRIASSLSNHVDLDDLEGYAAEGLLDAVDRYDSTRGAQFATFAAHRIRGAIYDGIRRTDWAPRSVRRKEREIRSNFARLCAEHGREPTEEEEAQALGVGLGALRSSKHQVADAHVGSLDYSHASDEGAAVEPEPRDPAPGPLTRWVESETSLELRTCLESLDERERTVTALSYCEGLTLAEIGARLGVSESRVCQIRSAAIRHLRAYARTHGLVPA